MLEMLLIKKAIMATPALPSLRFTLQSINKPIRRHSVSLMWITEKFKDIVG